MGDRAIARRYAKAFIELADEAGVTEALAGDLDRTLALLTSHEGMLFDALSNPVFDTEERRGVLRSVLPRLGLNPLTTNLLNLLLDNGRFGALPSIAAVYTELADERAGRVRVRVSTAEPLTPQLEAEVRSSFESLTGKSVLLDTTVDPTLIGGMVARVGSRVYDASVRTRLENLRQQLLAGQTSGSVASAEA